MKHIFALLLFVLIRSNSSCHKFQQITKEMVNRVDKPLEMFLWRIKEGKNLQQQRKTSIKQIEINDPKATEKSIKIFLPMRKRSPQASNGSIGKKRHCILGKSTIQVKITEMWQSPSMNQRDKRWSGQKELAAEGTCSPPAALWSPCLTGTLKGKEMEHDPLHTVWQHVSTRFLGWHSVKAA